jgi:cytoskeletal protein RodZ
VQDDKKLHHSYSSLMVEVLMSDVASFAPGPLLLQVFSKWMQVHGRTAASFFHNQSHKSATSASAISSDSTAEGASDAGQAPSARSKRAVVAQVPTAVVAKLIGGVTRVPIQLTSMAAPVETAPEAEEWLSAVQVDEEAVQEMQATLAHADEVCSRHGHAWQAAQSGKNAIVQFLDAANIIGLERWISSYCDIVSTC